jgi:hypothetical protein
MARMSGIEREKERKARIIECAWLLLGIAVQTQQHKKIQVQAK